MDIGEAARRYEFAVNAARAFFGVGDEWEVILIAESPQGACSNITAELAYLRATIRFDVDYYQVHPQDIWRHAAHEVAHLVTVEAAHIRDLYQEGMPDRETIHVKHTEAIERATVRLDRLFVRCNPQPDWGLA